MSINKATKGILGGAGDITITNRFIYPLFLSIKHKKPKLTLSIPRKKLLDLTIRGGGSINEPNNQLNKRRFCYFRM